MSVPERVLSVLRALPGVTEEVLWGNDLVYKVGGKMFAVFGLMADPTSERPDAGGSFKVRDADFDDLAARPGLRPAPYLARAKWIAFDGWRVLPIAELEERLKASYELVRAGLPRKLQASLGAPGAGAAKSERASARTPTKAARKPTKAPAKAARKPTKAPAKAARKPTKAPAKAARKPTKAPAKAARKLKRAPAKR